MSIFLLKEPDAVFIHIPKTGGASIRRGLFGGQCEGPYHGQVPPEWRDKFSFAFVRNPFDRLISAWKMFTAGMENTVWQMPDDADPGLSLDDFLAIVTDGSIRYDEPRDTLEVKIRHHAIPQTHPYNCLDAAEFVGRFERFEQDFAQLRGRLGVAVPLPHMNRTVRGDYRPLFTDSARHAATAFYRDDLDALGYEF